MTVSPGDSRTLPKLTQALRSQTRSGSGTQKKLKIFENSCPRQLLKLACTGLHLQCLIVWDEFHGQDQDVSVGADVLDISRYYARFACFFVRFSSRFPRMCRHAQTQALRSQTRSGSGTQKKLKIFENSCPRQLLKLDCTVWDEFPGQDQDGK